MADFHVWHEDYCVRAGTFITIYSAHAAAEKYVADMEWEEPKPMSEECEPLTVFVQELGETEVERFSVRAVHDIKWKAERLEDAETSNG